MKRLVGSIVFFVLSGLVQAQVVHTIFGNINEANPAILSILDSDALQRLKSIDQSGPEPYYFANLPTFTRYDHSIGVYALLKKFNASEDQQLAGLLHDASHTVFSHLADIMFQNGAERSESYQDTIHAWYLTKMGVDTILSKHNITIEQIMPKRADFKALEQPYPDMNADRIEYNIHTALVLNDLTQQDVNAIVKTLKFDNNTWYFTNILYAKRFAKLSTYYTKTFWGSPRNIAFYTIAGAMLKRAIEQGVISRDEFHFGTDEQVLAKLKVCEDKLIHKLNAMLENIDKHYIKADAKDYDVHQPVKMRGINPYVLHNNDLVRLSELCIDFKNDLESTTEYSNAGIYLKFTNIDPEIQKMLRQANV